MTIDLRFQGWKAAPQRMIFDRRRGLVTIVLRDGTVVTDGLTNLPPAWDGFDRSEVDLAAGELILTLGGGEKVVTDLGWPGQGDGPPPDTPVVYLDQNHWIALAIYRQDPEKLDDHVREAAAKLIELAEQREVVLPYSAGHLTEIVPRGQQRRNVALTMLTLSRGFQMRNPLEVRQRELRACISGSDPSCTEVFTLAPDALFAGDTSFESPEDFPAVMKEIHKRLAHATANVAVMIEDDETPAPETDPRQRWLDTYGAFANDVHGNRLSREETRSVAHDVLVEDLRSEIAQAAASINAQGPGFRSWLRDRLEADLERAPYIRTLKELLYHRLRSQSDRWELNDLVDMHYLSCAGGYADLVVAERKFSDYLGRARRRHGTNAVSVARLTDGVIALSDGSISVDRRAN